MKEKLQSLLSETLRDFAARKNFSVPADFDFELMVTRDPSHGDWSTNAAFKISKLLKVKPSEAAAAWLEVIKDKSKSAGVIDRVEVAGPGFINFYLTKSSLGQILFEIRDKDISFGQSDYGKGKKVLLEFVSANPTGPLTIAHGRQAAVGDALARILRTTGHEAQSEYYLNDGGRQMRMLGASLYARYCQELGRNEPLSEEGYQGAYLIDIAKQLIKEKGETLLREAREKAVEFCTGYAGRTIMDGINEDLKSIDVKFQSYFNESDLYKNGAVDEALGFLKQKGYLYESEGALWFKSTDLGDDKDRVVKKSSGEFTYLAPDIAYHRNKFLRGFNWLVNFLGPDHHGYIARLKAACQALGHKADQIEVRIVQVTTLYRQGQPVRMSTRAGEFVTLRELVQEVGPDATRCFFCMRKIESPLDFDLDLAKEKSQENPVYYFQYAHARIASILRNANRVIPKKPAVERLTAPEETELIKRLSEYTPSLIKASELLEPYRLVDYLRELAAAFHKFYTFHRVITEDQELTDARLLLVNAVRIVMRNGLTLLGISHPDSM